MPIPAITPLAKPDKTRNIALNFQPLIVSKLHFCKFYTIFTIFLLILCVFLHFFSIFYTKTLHFYIIITIPANNISTPKITEIILFFSFESSTVPTIPPAIVPAITGHKTE